MLSVNIFSVKFLNLPPSKIALYGSIISYLGSCLFKAIVTVLTSVEDFL